MSDFKIQYLRYCNNDIWIHSNVYFTSRKQAFKATRWRFFCKIGNKCWGTFSTFGFCQQSNCSPTNPVKSVQNHVQCGFINILYQVIKIAIHVQLVLHFKTFLRKFHKSHFWWKTFKIARTLQDIVSKITIKSQIETSIPIPNQYITKLIDLSNPSKPAIPMRTEAYSKGSNFVQHL